MRCRAACGAHISIQQTKVNTECGAVDSCPIRLEGQCFPEQHLVNIAERLVSIAVFVAGIMMIIIPRTLSTTVAVFLSMVDLVRLLGAGKVLR